MHFCPCSCSKADGENEEDVLICLPRNLSYAGESYLDRYSVSSAFVHNSKLEKQFQQADVEERYLKAGATACVESQRLEQKLREENGEEEEPDTNLLVIGVCAMADPYTCSDDPSRAEFRGPDNCDQSAETTMSLSPSASVPTPFIPPLAMSIDRGKGAGTQSDFDRYVIKTAESPDSDLVSEEGIFVNMMDDLDGLGGVPVKSTLSEASDDTYVSGDSMYYSPAEVEGIEDKHLSGEFRVSLEEAMQQAVYSLKPHNEPQYPVVENSVSHDHQQIKLFDEYSHPQDANTEPKNESDTKSDIADSETQLGASDSEMKSDENYAEIVSEMTNSECSLPSVDVEPCHTSPESANAVAETDTSVTLVTENRKLASGLEITINDRPFQYDDKRQLSSSYRDLVSPESPVYEDREFNFTRSELRKSTSLKSSKTPPGTPRRKKVVRFADAMGLDLESVRHVLNLDSPPKIPPSAMKDLQVGLSEDRKDIGTKFITETFTQPGADLHFRERVLVEKVVLENALIVSGSITGVVRVANIAFHKRVRVRFTTNGWASFHDIAASYMQNSNDGGTDRFSFTIVPPQDFSAGSKLEFAISFTVNGIDYWDNNKGDNYCFECYAKTIPTEAENAWMHFL